MFTKTLKTANTNGYVIDLGGEHTNLELRVRTGEVWAQPVLKGGVITTPTNAAIPANPGDVTDFLHMEDGDTPMIIDLSHGFAALNQNLRFTHLRVYSVAAAEFTVFGV